MANDTLPKTLKEAATAYLYGQRAEEAFSGMAHADFSELEARVMAALADEQGQDTLTLDSLPLSEERLRGVYHTGGTVTGRWESRTPPPSNPPRRAFNLPYPVRDFHEVEDREAHELAVKNIARTSAAAYRVEDLTSAASSTLGLPQPDHRGRDGCIVEYKTAQARRQRSSHGNGKATVNRRAKAAHGDQPLKFMGMDVSVSPDVTGVALVGRDSQGQQYVHHVPNYQAQAAEAEREIRQSTVVTVAGAEALARAVGDMSRAAQHAGDALRRWAEAFPNVQAWHDDMRARRGASSPTLSPRKAPPRPPKPAEVAPRRARRIHKPEGE